MKAFANFRSIVIGQKMHKEKPRLFGQHVTVKRRYLDAVTGKRADDLVDLGGDQGKGARNGCDRLYVLVLCPIFPDRSC